MSPSVPGPSLAANGISSYRLKGKSTRISQPSTLTVCRRCFALFLSDPNPASFTRAEEPIRSGAVRTVLDNPHFQGQCPDSGGFVAKSGTPAHKAQQMNGPEVETLVNALISSTESPIGSKYVFKSVVLSASSAAGRTAGSGKSSDPTGSEVTRSARWRALLEFRRRR